MSKGTVRRHTKRAVVMDLELFMRTALQSIIRGMKDLSEDSYKAKDLAIVEQEARIDFKLSLEAMKDGRIHVAKIDGKASPNSNRIEFSVKIAADRTMPPTITISTRELPGVVPHT